MAGRHLLCSLRGYLEMDERLSGFQGIDFREGFSTRRAKTLLKSLMQTVRPDVLTLYPDLTGGRPGITVDRLIVWDCFGVEPTFTADLHLTVSVREEETAIALTLPNAATKRWRRLCAILEDPTLTAQLETTLAALRRRVPDLWLRLDHRHFIGQRRIVPDAVLEFRVDTRLRLPGRLPACGHSPSGMRRLGRPSCGGGGSISNSWSAPRSPMPRCRPCGRRASPTRCVRHCGTSSLSIPSARHGPASGENADASMRRIPA